MGAAERHGKHWNTVAADYDDDRGTLESKTMALMASPLVIFQVPRTALIGEFFQKN